MTKNTNNFSNIFDKASSNRKLYVFLFCLILAIFFWLLNSLSKNFTTTIDFEVTYINSPENRVVINELPPKINIKIKGLGFDLLAYKLSLKQPDLIINLSQINGNNKPFHKIENVQLPSTFFLSSIANQLGDNIEIKELTPSTFNFVFDEKKEKNVKILSNTTIDFEKQFQLFGQIQVKPAVTKIIGPASVIDTIEAVYLEKRSYQQLSETVSEAVEFSSVYTDQKITFKDNKVVLYIPVEKYTESSVTISIEALNVPDSLLIKAIPNEIELKFMLPLSKIASLSSAQFKAVIDYKQINESLNHKLKVDLVEYPDYIQVQNLTPSKVEYILKRK